MRAARGATDYYALRKMNRGLFFFFRDYMLIDLGQSSSIQQLI